MFATGTPQSPVASLEKYILKRNKETDRLFLQPRNSFIENDIEMNLLEKILYSISCRI
jgi:hypothetical protein